MLTDGDIVFNAAQDDRYFTEKGFRIGLSFPGSSAVDPAMRGGKGEDLITGLADMNPFTATLARLSQSENGVTAGLPEAWPGHGPST